MITPVRSSPDFLLIWRGSCAYMDRWSQNVLRDDDQGRTRCSIELSATVTDHTAPKHHCMICEQFVTDALHAEVRLHLDTTRTRYAALTDARVHDLAVHHALQCAAIQAAATPYTHILFPRELLNLAHERKI